MMKILADENEKEWDEVIPMVEMAIRNARNSTTKFSPNDVIFGHLLSDQNSITIENHENGKKQFVS